MLEYSRYRAAAGVPARAPRGRVRLPLPVGAAAAGAAPGLARDRLAGLRARAAGRGARRPAAHAPAARPPPHGRPHVTVEQRLAHLRDLLSRSAQLLLRRGREGRRPPDRGGDPVRAARALQGGRGRAGSRRSPSARSRWSAADERARAHRRGAALPVVRAGVGRAAGRGLRGLRGRGRRGARAPARALRRGLPRRRAARGRGRLHAGHRPGGRARRAPAARHARARRRSPRPRPSAWRSSPTCSRSRGPRSPASAASPPSPPSPRCSSAA